MVGELQNNCNNLNLTSPIHACSISDYNSEDADLALAVFTVLSYSTTDDELLKSINNICKHIKPEGYFFFDLPKKVFFEQPQIEVVEGEFKRSVELRKTELPNVYTYNEICSGNLNGQEFEYTEVFNIRYWEIDTLHKILIENGLKRIDKNFFKFENTGSSYYLYQKNG